MGPINIRAENNDKNGWEIVDTTGALACCAFVAIREKTGIQCSFFLWNTHSGLFPNGKPCGKRHSDVGDHFPPAPILPHLSKTNPTGIEKYFF
ncbi:hypothetical protein [Pseudodesulfovibrio portus]|uniref:Uncharacterized protein n=1 Tax=Pseudodesulfovibrio portus TaxID=231439 RepID=A0ABN6RZU0_9BACT|nr:hypothetical protein [Pseudodesulfovibrio portus]BDQ35167.1 hypothetical protein JCM14722_27090 [Pseudodesulfovibrio portus]